MKMLVLVPKVTGRVMYAMELLLGQLLGLEFDCTVDAEQFNAYEGPKMQYGSQRQGEAPFVKAGWNILATCSTYLSRISCDSSTR